MITPALDMSPLWTPVNPVYRQTTRHVLTLLDKLAGSKCGDLKCLYQETNRSNSLLVRINPCGVFLPLWERCAHAYTDVCTHSQHYIGSTHTHTCTATQVHFTVTTKTESSILDNTGSVCPDFNAR